MKKPIFICFIGIDGSGKTTQAKALVDMLEEMGLESRYVYNRSEPILTKPFIAVGKALFFGGKGKFDNYREYSIRRQKVFKNSLLSAADQNSLLVDNSLQNIARLSLPLILSKSSVCDRYIHDTVVDLAVDLNYPDGKTKTMLKNFLYLVPKPDLVFLIDAPEEMAYQRKNDIPSLDFLKERRKVYLDMAKEYEMMVIDGSRELVELECLIQSRVNEVINWKVQL